MTTQNTQDTAKHLEQTATTLTSLIHGNDLDVPVTQTQLNAVRARLMQALEAIQNNPNLHAENAEGEALRGSMSVIEGVLAAIPEDACTVKELHGALTTKPGVPLGLLAQLQDANARLDISPLVANFSSDAEVEKCGVAAHMGEGRAPGVFNAYNASGTAGIRDFCEQIKQQAGKPLSQIRSKDYDSNSPLCRNALHIVRIAEYMHKKDPTPQTAALCRAAIALYCYTDTHPEINSSKFHVNANVQVTLLRNEVVKCAAEVDQVQNQATQQSGASADHDGSESTHTPGLGGR